MFVGRKKELDSLLELWDKPGASLVVCRGRRRIGKSTLVAEFARRSGAAFAGITAKGVEWHLKQLKAAGRLRRVGPARGGHRKVVEHDR